MSTHADDFFVDPCDADDVVISGISGRFSGSKNIEEFKEKLYNGKEVITRAKCFMVNTERARIMDPQSRLLLETVYECIIDAGYNPVDLRGSNTGVFIGVPGSESNINLVKNISYVFNFVGQSFAADTACTSCFFAMYQAVTAIRNGVCDSAVVGEANILLSPDLGTTRHNLLSPDGSANGYVRAEAVSTIFLQKARDARRVYASVVNIRTNVDDYKPEDMTFPNGTIQNQLMREVYMECGVDPTDVSYVEAHGTGTAIDDAEEVNAVANLFCKGRTEPLLIGSVKSNMGHAESDSGICAIVKALLALESGIIPANSHFEKPNPDIRALVDGRIKVVDSPAPLNGDLVAINNLGFGGTHAHLVLRRNPKRKLSTQNISSVPEIVIVSGRTEFAVNAMIDKVMEHDSDQELLALIRNIHSTNVTGNRYRGYGIQNNFETVREVSECPSVKRPVWYVFSGMATQWIGMGRSMLSIEVFKQSMERTAAVLKTKNFNLMKLILNGSSEDFENIFYIPPCIVAIQIALVDVLKAVGIEPDGIIGHSMGELCCGYADGAFTAEQTILAAYFRGKCISEAKLEDGRMAAVGLTWEEAKKRCPEFVFPACHNGIDTVAISGLHKPLAKFVDELVSEGVFAKLVNVANVAFHSKYVEKACEQMQLELQNIIPTPKRRSSRWISSSVPEDKWQHEMAQYCSAQYVINNVKSPVLFYEALQHLPNNAIVVEIGPNHVISVILRRSFSSDLTHIGLQKADHVDNASYFLTCLGKMYMAGVQVQLSNLYPTISYPVGRGTPMISPFIEWDHSENWPGAEVNNQPKVRDNVIDASEELI